MHFFTDSKKLNHVLKRENNNFDFIRLICAVGVIIFHSFYLFTDQQNYELSWKIFCGESIGGLSVYVFFFLSGMFITSSFIRLNNSRNYIIMRVLRIWPALIVCILLTSFIVGPLVSAYTTKEYFGKEDTWQYLFHGVLLYHVRYELPGVFIKNHLPSAVNGSIWTLPMEVTCYIITLLIGFAGFFKSKKAVLAMYCVILLLYFVNLLHIRNYFAVPFPFFFIGGIFFILKDDVIVDYKVLLLLIGAYCVIHNLYILYAILMYGTLVIGSSTLLRKISLPGDYSYGIYIYGFLVQQIVAFYLPHTPPIQSIFICIPIAAIMGALSWHFVEYPSIKLAKSKSTKKPVMIATVNTGV